MAYPKILSNADHVRSRAASVALSQPPGTNTKLRLDGTQIGAAPGRPTVEPLVGFVYPQPRQNRIRFATTDAPTRLG